MLLEGIQAILDHDFEKAMDVFQQDLAIRPNQGSVHLFSTQRGIMILYTLQRRLVHYSQQCNVPVTTHRLSHTFASQMLATCYPYPLPKAARPACCLHTHFRSSRVYNASHSHALAFDFASVGVQ